MTVSRIRKKIIWLPNRAEMTNVVRGADKIDK